MCHRCDVTQNFDPCRHGPDAVEYAVFSEGVDAAASTSTQYTMTAGDTFNGTLFRGDSDWVRITLVAGETYEFNMQGNPSGAGTLYDPYLILRNASGVQITFDDDGGLGLESQLTYTATATGTYYLDAQAYSSFDGGSYQLSARIAEPNVAQVGTLDELADYLRVGYWQDSGGGGARSFDTSSDNIITVNIRDLTAEGQQLARWAFEAWEMVIDVDFREVSFGADITFDDNDSGAYASSSTSGGRILSSEVNISAEWIDMFGSSIDSYSFSTYIHEIGHAIGLGHQGDYNGDARYGQDETFINDSWQISVMSYFSQSQNTSVNASEAELISAMMADILAAQDLYGAAGAGSATDGDTIWGAGTNLTGYWGDYFREISGAGASATYDGGRVAFTVFDTGGIDTVDLSFLSTADRIDMRAERFSDVAGLIGNVGVARGTVLENLILGAGNDEVIGNDADNVIEGGAGRDTLSGGAGMDTVSYANNTSAISVNLANNSASDGDQLSGFEGIAGSDHNDTLTGNASANTIAGAAGNDTINGLGGDDVMQGGAGHDSLMGGFGFDTLEGGDGNDTLDGEGNSDVLLGGLGADVLYGGVGTDRLEGEEGNDRLFSGDGADRVFGGDGDDLIRAGSNVGLTVDGAFGGAGNDTIFGDGGFDLLEGGDGDDSLNGGGQADNLFGGAGNDTLDGGLGLDRLFAGADDDLLMDFDGTGGLFGEAGNDTIHNGDDANNIFGGQGNDWVEAGGGDDTVNGGSGFDTIIGGRGDDELNGRFNADTFVFFDGDGNDTIGDFAAGNTFERIDFSNLSTINSLADLDLGSATSGAAIQDGADVLIDTGGGNSVRLTNVAMADLDATDFIF